MALPRRLKRGQPHTTTRRTAQRTCLLVADPAVRQAILYLIGWALEKCPGVKFHGAVFEATHKHDFVSDSPSEPKLAFFYQLLHGFIARVIKAHYGWTDNVWRPGSVRNVEVDPSATESQWLYQCLNPVEDRLALTPDAFWEQGGVIFRPEDFGKTFTIERPPWAYFGVILPEGWEPTDPRRRAEVRAERERRAALKASSRAERRAKKARRKRSRRGGKPGRRRPRGDRSRVTSGPLAPTVERKTKMPKTVTFKVDVPPGWDEEKPELAREHFRALLDAEVAKIHDRHRAAGLPLVRKSAVHPFTRLTSEPKPSGSINPRIACKDPDRIERLIADLKAWRADYAEALARWPKSRSVRFPTGTYWMRVFHRAKVVPPPTGPPSAA